MSYLTTKECYGRPETVLDLERFAADLAKAIGGKLMPDENKIGDRYRSIELDGCEIGLTKGWQRNEIDKVTVRISPLDVKFGYREQPSGADYKMPRATMSTSRPLDRLVADIKRRVIEPAKAPIAKLREYAAEQCRRANSLADIAERLQATYPGLSVTVEKGATSSGSLYRNGNGPYLSGRVYNDGQVSIDRLGTLSAEQFERVMAALYND